MISTSAALVGAPLRLLPVEQFTVHWILWDLRPLIATLTHAFLDARLFRSWFQTAQDWNRRPVGSGKTALVEALCTRLKSVYQLALITNDIYTREDAEFLTRRGVLFPDWIVDVETGDLPPFDPRIY